MWKGKRKNERKSGVSPVGYLKKQSQFCSYCVLCDAYCENELEKTKPICQVGKSSVKSYLKGYYEEIATVWAAKNKANCRPLAGNPKH